MRVYHYNLHYYRKNYTYRLQSHIKNSLPDLHFTIKNSSCMNKYQAAINSREHILQATFTNDEDGRETTCCRQRIPVNCSRRQCLAPRSIPSAGQTQCCSSGVYQLTMLVPWLITSSETALRRELYTAAWLADRGCYCCCKVVASLGEYGFKSRARYPSLCSLG